MNNVTVNEIVIGDKNPLVLISGPCVLEDEKTVLSIAEKLKKISLDFKIPLIFKASYEKDNRSTIEGYRGPGLKRGLPLLKKVKDEFDLPVLSDVHRESDVDCAKEILDIIQVPAFLCNQTSLLVKVGSSGKPVNIKKGQYMAPENMRNSVEKIRSCGNNSILLTERGSCFGYNHLISDVCSIPVMQQIGCPVLYDATHIVRIYGNPSSDMEKGGKAAFIKHLSCSGVAAGCDGLFLEVHPDPVKALCDSASMLKLDLLPKLLELVLPISRIVRES